MKTLLLDLLIGACFIGVVAGSIAMVALYPVATALSLCVLAIIFG